MRDSAAAFASSAAEGVEAVGCAFDSAAGAGPPPDGVCPPPVLEGFAGAALGANEVGPDFPASAAAFTASADTGAPPT